MWKAPEYAPSQERQSQHNKGFAYLITWQSPLPFGAGAGPTCDVTAAD